MKQKKVSTRNLITETENLHNLKHLDPKPSPSHDARKIQENPQKTKHASSKIPKNLKNFQ